MHVIALILAALAALVHVYIFVLESLRWEQPRTRAVFGTTAETAAITRQLAFNQGFYNLFLAIMVAAGIALAALPAISATLLVAGLGSMLAAALVLALSDAGKRRAALIQGAAPALSLLALAVAAL